MPEQQHTVLGAEQCMGMGEYVAQWKQHYSNKSGLHTNVSRSEVLLEKAHECKTAAEIHGSMASGLEEALERSTQDILVYHHKFMS